jgi:D-aminopeptidase
MIVVATDAPLDARQLTRLSKRGALGIARVGGSAANGSGDFVISFSTAYQVPHGSDSSLMTVTLLRDGSSELDRLFLAAAEAVEEAILNALWTARSIVGRDSHEVSHVRA